MIFGFGLPTRGPLAQPDAIKTVLEKAEKLGLGYVSVADHIVIPKEIKAVYPCLLYTSPSPRDATLSRMPSSA